MRASIIWAWHFGQAGRSITASGTMDDRDWLSDMMVSSKRAELQLSQAAQRGDNYVFCFCARWSKLLSFAVYSFLLQNGAMPLHWRGQISPAIGNAALPPNIPNLAIDRKRGPRGSRRRSKSREETPNRGSGRGAAAHPIFQIKKARALTGLNFCSGSPIRMAGMWHDHRADDDDCSKSPPAGLLIFGPLDATNDLVPGRTL
jgi:hypothetical protein